MAAAAAHWGTGLPESLIFVARQRPPLHVPATGAGEFILNPHQEVYAFLPTSGRFRQLTAEDGHVLAVARTPDGRRIVYVTGEKLIRGAKPGDLTLEGVALHELTLASMTASPPVPIAGAVRRLEIAASAHELVFRIDGDRLAGRFALGAGNTLVAAGPAAGPPPLVVLTGSGVSPSREPATPASSSGACRISVREIEGGSAGRSILVSTRGRPSRSIGGTLGAGLVGLPLP
jgi:hypothetical protein